MFVIVFSLALTLVMLWRYVAWKLDPKPPPTMSMVIRTILMLFALAVGWGFIAWENRFHFSPSLVIIMIGYFAVVMVVYNLWRTGAAAVGGEEADDDVNSWGRPIGASDELEREKRTLLKAIKEAEFDHEMGKLSKVDVDAMIQMYRHRAIEVIKELERVGGGGAVGVVETKREQIEREVRARLEVETKAGGAKQKKQPKNKQGTGNREQATGNADANAEAAPEKVAVSAPAPVLNAVSTAATVPVAAAAATVPVAVTAPPDDDEPKARKGVVARDAETVESGGIRVAAAAVDAKAAASADASKGDSATASKGDAELLAAKAAGNAGATAESKADESKADAKADAKPVAAAKADESKAEAKAESKTDTAATADKAEAKAEAKTDAAAKADKAEAKAEAKPDAAAKADESKAEAKDAKTESKNGVVKAEAVPATVAAVESSDTKEAAR